MKEKNRKSIIIFSIIFLVVGLGSGYILGSNISKNKIPSGFDNMNGAENFGRLNLSDSVKTNITNFFESSPSNSEVSSYCQENPSYCIYYCSEIDSGNDICDKFGGAMNQIGER